MATRMQQRRGTAAQWISTNNGDGPILNAGEIGFESDSGKFKIGDGVNHWVDLDYFTTGSAEDVQNQINAAIANLVDGAPALLNTLNELAAAIGDDPSFITTIATNLSNHESDTTNVHGIANTADLATKSYADGAVSTHNSDTTDVHGIANTAELATKTFAAELLTNATKTNISITGDKNGLTITAENGVADSDTDDLVEGTTNKYFTNQRALDATSAAYDPAGAAATAQQNAENYADGLASNYDAAGTASSAVSAHNLDTTNVHGIANTALLATQQYVDDAVSNAEVDQSTLAGVGIDWSGSQFDIDSTVVTLDESQTLENKTISYTNNTITVQVANVSDLTASAAELNTLDGITASVNELNVLDGVTASTAELNVLDGMTATTAELNILDGATLDVTELNYLDGVTSSVQTQLDDKLSKTGGTMTGDITLAGLPTQALHAATKSYVDAVTEGLHIHASCVAATTANLSIATDLGVGDVVDGVTLAEGDRVLVKAQTNAAQNGIYVVQASGAALRASDFNEPQEVDGGDFVFVTGGTLHDNTGWVQTTANVVTIGTDPIVFTQFSGAGTYTAGTGLDLDGTVFSIDTATTVDVSTAQTLTNKTISAANNTITIATTNITDVTASAAELNILDGATLSTAELNLLDGVTASTAELNILDGVTATASEINVLDGVTASTAELNILDGVTATALELNVLDGITASTAELNYVDGVTSAIQTQIDSKAPTNSPTFTGTVSGVTKAHVGLGNVDNTSDANKPVSTATQTALDLKANLAGPTFTGNVVLPSTTSIGNVSATELGYLDGVTSAIQTQLNGKQAVVSGVSNTEIGYLDGVTSSIQTQLDGKAPKTSPVFTSSLTLNSGQMDAFTVDSSGNVVAGGAITGTNINSSSGFALSNGQQTTFSVDTSGNISAGGTVTAAMFSGNGSQLTGISSYSAPTLGTTQIASGATVSTIAGLTLTSPTINNPLVDEPILSSPEERWTVSAIAATGTIAFDAKTTGILYYTSNSSANWTLNVRGDGSTTLNNMLATNDSITVVFFATNGTTPFFQTGFQIDGTTVTPRWQNGSAPSAGNASSIDMYSFTIVKTANATFTVFGSQSRFA